MYFARLGITMVTKSKIVSILALASIMAQGQQSGTGPKFEVATIKVDQTGANGYSGGCRGVDGGPPQVPLGRCVIQSARLSHLIGAAWAVEMADLRTGPDWIQRGLERYHLEARAEDPRSVKRSDLQEMLKNLLIERFGLKYHYEERQHQGFALLPSKKGFKMAPSTADETQLRSGKAPAVIQASRLGMDLFVELLRGNLGQPVVDETGIKGFYDFDLRWDETNGPSLHSLLNDIGLRLEPRKVTLKTFVVDSAVKITTTSE